MVDGSSRWVFYVGCMDGPMGWWVFGEIHMKGGWWGKNRWKVWVHWMDG